MFDVLEPAAQHHLLTVPGDRRIDPIAAALLADPADSRTLTQWSHLVGVSERTVTRLFLHTTGSTFVRWRQLVRTHRAMSLLAEGHDVRTTSSLVGYAQPSTFIEAFRSVTGSTPGAMVRTKQKNDA